MFGCGGLDETALGPAAARTQVKAASRASVSCSVPQRRQTMQPAGWRVELKTPRQRKSPTNPRAWIPQVRPSEGSVVSGLTQPRKRKVRAWACSNYREREKASRHDYFMVSCFV